MVEAPEKNEDKYVVELDGFQGPLDLLLNLIEAEELDITQVALAKVTNEYLQSIEGMQEHNPDAIVDFLVVASQLMVIKSKALLPLLILDAEEELDARELEFRLKQLKLFRDYSLHLEKALGAKKILFGQRFVPPKNAHFLPAENISLESIQEALKEVLHQLPQDEFLDEEVIHTGMSTKEKMGHIRKNLEKLTKIKFQDMVMDKASKMEVVITFLAMLELLKQRIISVEQSEHFGEITLTPVGADAE